MFRCRTRTSAPIAAASVAAAMAFPAITEPAAAGSGGEPVAVDSARNIYIPPEETLQRTLRVGAVYNDDAIQIRYEYAVDEPSWYHQYWIREDGEWVRHGTGGPEPDPHGLYEDRISMMLDDGDVGLARYGGFMTSHEGVRSLTSAVTPEAVEAHPHLGERLGRSDVRKYIHQSRRGERGEAAWDAVKDSDELEALRDEGVFIDLWQWRAHRSNPHGYGDNGYILEYRHSSGGRGMYTDNQDEATGGPAWMYDPDAAGFRALDADALRDGAYGQDDLYYLHEDHAVPYDPDHAWEDGDALPHRLLREPEGSRGAIRADGRWEDGVWRVRLTRSLEAPDPRDSHALEDGETYAVAFAVHEARGQRWHRVSLPQTLGLGVKDAEITARRVDGDLDEAAVDWQEVTLIYPGQMTWQWVNSPDHPGSVFVQRGGHSLWEQHEPEELLQRILDHERALYEEGARRDR